MFFFGCSQNLFSNLNTDDNGPNLLNFLQMVRWTLCKFPGYYENMLWFLRGYEIKYSENSDF